MHGSVGEEGRFSCRQTAMMDTRVCGCVWIPLVIFLLCDWNTCAAKITNGMFVFLFSIAYDSV